MNDSGEKIVDYMKMVYEWIEYIEAGKYNVMVGK